jgi:hypothetical protein
VVLDFASAQKPEEAAKAKPAGLLPPWLISTITGSWTSGMHFMHTVLFVHIKLGFIAFVN